MGGFFYNTNGFAFHRLEDVVPILAELGYDGVALTPDVHHLDPARSTRKDVLAFRALLERHGLAVIVETGARYVLDPARKHRPSLLDPPVDAARRLAFLEQCVLLAHDLGGPIVSTWSGTGPEGQSHGAGLERLVVGLRALCEFADDVGVDIGFEPEPGMAVERTDEWPEIRERVAHPRLGLTLDVGHCLATGEGDPAAILRAHAADLRVLQLDDHRPGRHEHLAFGEGEVDFRAVAQAAREVGFEGPLEVELSRHASTATTTAEASIRFLREIFS
jgi:sugar phosphate isomerase/epimerase